MTDISGISFCNGSNSKFVTLIIIKIKIQIIAMDNLKKNK